MRVLFDQGTPLPLREFLRGHEVVTAFEIGWSELSNGELLAKAEERFDVFVTTDQQLRYQQDLKTRKITVVILPFANWMKLRGHAEKIAAAISSMPAGGYIEIQVE